MKSKQKSFSNISSSVQIPKEYSFFKKLMTFVGPAYLVSVGYMDPGNWATDIAAGSQFGYALLWVLLASNLIAVLLQSLSLRLGIVTGKDLAQACRSHYSKQTNFYLWILSEIAIIATDLAEVLGSAIGIQLLFGIPLIYAVLITAFDTILILFLHNAGIRKMEAFIIGLISIIGLSFLVEIIIARPDIGGIANGLLPTLPGKGALFIAIGILGATVMPHNLYLHSSLVQSRNFEKSEKGIKQALKFNFVDSLVALTLALFVNAAILIMAAAVFFKSGNTEIEGIQQAYRLLEPILGTSIAPALFGVALIASGQASTITGTLSGQIVMEGFINIRLRPWVRRLVTRLFAIIPALVAIIYLGEKSTTFLLVLSQVILSLQLSFAVIPLIQFVSNKSLMNRFVISNKVKIISWITVLGIVSLNIKLVSDTLIKWFNRANQNIFFVLPVLAITIVLGVFLIYLIFEPLLSVFIQRRPVTAKTFGIHGDDIIPIINKIRPYKRIALALDFSEKDGEILSHGVNLAREDTSIILVHIVESVAAEVLGNESGDSEVLQDSERIKKYAEELRKIGIKDVQTEIGFGSPAKALIKIIRDSEADIAIFGSHGHKGLNDLIFGTTSNKVKHNVAIPILIAQ